MKRFKTFKCFIVMLFMALTNVTNAFGMPDNGYYRIKGVQNGRYVEVVAQFMSAPNVAESNKYAKAGTVMYLNAEADGKINVLRSQGVPYPNYFDLILQATQDYVAEQVGGLEGYTRKDADMYIERTNDNDEMYYAKVVIPSIDDLVEYAADKGLDTTTDDLWLNGITKAADQLADLGIPSAFIVAYLQGLAKPGDTYYLTDDGSSFGGVNSEGLEAKGNLAKWYIEPVNNEDGFYFGVNATVEYNGKNYATLYTDFPYQLPDGVKAYTVGNMTAGVATLVPVEGDIVPSQTPVILECDKQDAKYNRLLPIGQMEEGNDGEYEYAAYPPIDKNVLFGVFFNENADVYALSTQDGNLAFSSAQTIMVGNRAYGNLEAMLLSLNLPVGYYRIQGVEKQKYTQVLMQFLSAPIVANDSKYTMAGTVMYLDANADGTVNMLRSQAIPYPNYFNPVLKAGQEWVLEQIGYTGDYDIRQIDLVCVPTLANGLPAYYATISLPTLTEICELAAEGGLEITPKEVWTKGVDLAKGDIAAQYGIADIFIQAYLYPLDPGNTYFLTDDGGSFGTVAESGLEAKGNLAKWYIEPVDEENYFGINCLSGTADGKYGDVKKDDYWYATAYFDFPYYLSDNNGTINTSDGVVKAYIVTGFNEQGDAICESIGKAVPAQTPVLLECTKEEAKYNKLYPTTDEIAPVEGNILQGNEYLEPCDYTINNKYFFNITWKDEWANKVRTLDVKKWNEEDGWLLGFYAFNYTNYLTGNKAFIYLDDVDYMSDYIKDQNNTSNPTGVTAHANVKGSLLAVNGEAAVEKVVSEDAGLVDGINSVTKDEGNGVKYDLQGHKVTKPFSGVFIINGKKVVIK